MIRLLSFRRLSPAAAILAAALSACQLITPQGASTLQLPPVPAGCKVSGEVSIGGMAAAGSVRFDCETPAAVPAR